MVGIISCPETQEYNYFTLKNLPEVTEEIKSKMKDATHQIINTGIDKDILEAVLIEKGYLVGQYIYSKKSVIDLYKEPEFTTTINVKIDSFMRRV